MKVKTQKLITMLLGLSILVNTQIVKAEEEDPNNHPSPTPSATATPAPSTCGQVIGACDKALDAKNKEIAVHKELESTLKDQNSALEKKIISDDNVLKKPAIYTTVGVIAVIAGGPIAGPIIGGVIILSSIIVTELIH